MFDPSLSSDASRNTRQRDQQLRRQSLRHSWPVLVLMPVLVGVLHACAFSVLINLFLGEHFGLSNGNPAPWPGAIAVLLVVSFWANRSISRLSIPGPVAQLLTMLVWGAAWLAWLALDPAFDAAQIWTKPGELVKSDGWLIPSLLISMVIWWVGMRYASDIASTSAEEMRTVVQRDWIVLFGSILLAAFIGGDAASGGLAAARLAVPLLLIVSVALIAAAENEGTRRIAIRRGGTPPGWGRWFRLVGGLSLGIVVLSVLILAILSPEALSAIMNGISTVGRYIGWVLSWVLYAIVWVVFQLGMLIGRLIEAIFGDIFGPVQPPEMPANVGVEMEMEEREQTESGPWQYATLLRWGALGAVVLVIALVMFRLTRRDVAEVDGDVDEHRDSVFSTDLARKQLRDLFRRREREAKPLVLNLNQPPSDLRETMTYLEVLARRQGEARRPDESATDFAARLRAHWPGLANPLVELPQAYDRARYGEVTEATDGAISERVWQEIWSRRRDAPPPNPEGERPADPKWPE